MNINKKIKSIILLLLLLTISCTENPVSTKQEVYNGQIKGQVSFLDGTPAVDARIRLKNLTSARSTYDTTDNNGNFSFDNLTNDEYQIVYQSPTYFINNYESSIFKVNSDTTLNNFNLSYKYLDDQAVQIYNNDVFFIKFNTDAGRIGQNQYLVESLSGYFWNDILGNATLGCKVYKIPDGFNWSQTDVELTPTYIENNFAFLFSQEEIQQDENHFIFFSGEAVSILLSNPSNGLAFVKSSGENKVLRVPCVDFKNNDFGLVFNYKN